MNFSRLSDMRSAKISEFPICKICNKICNIYRCSFCSTYICVFCKIIHECKEDLSLNKKHNYESKKEFSLIKNNKISDYLKVNPLIQENKLKNARNSLRSFISFDFSDNKNDRHDSQRILKNDTVIEFSSFEKIEDIIQNCNKINKEKTKSFEIINSSEDVIEEISYIETIDKNQPKLSDIKYIDVNSEINNSHYRSKDIERKLKLLRIGFDKILNFIHHNSNIEDYDDREWNKNKSSQKSTPFLLKNHISKSTYLQSEAQKKYYEKLLTAKIIQILLLMIFVISILLKIVS